VSADAAAAEVQTYVAAHYATIPAFHRVYIQFIGVANPLRRKVRRRR
jgi:hypothetical protein